MPDIQKLDSLLIAKIAAGEVIERPVSVVKELIENAIDANSTDIRIEVVDGGIESLMVSDDGIGMSELNMPMAFEHHATSKIRNDDDLFNIETLGFRGEALPSIASVAHVNMRSRVRESDFGFNIENSFGVLSNAHPSACQPGTEIIVSKIFDNLPARKKFQKSARSENIRIKGLIVRYMCAYPAIKFRLISDGKTILNSPGNGSLKDAVSECFGSEISSEFINVEFERDGHLVSGYISPTHLHRSNRQGMIFFVNGRSVNNLVLSRAFTEAYHGLIPQKRFPVGILNLDVPFDEIDVNAHPAKTEVRFLREAQIFSNIQRAVRENISQFSGIGSVQSVSHGTSPTPEKTHESVYRQFDMMRQDYSVESVDTREPIPGGIFRATLKDLHVLGQVKSTFIVGETSSGVYLIDQHAAHERIVFDKLNDDINQLDQTPQILLEPIHLELNAEQLEYFNENETYLKAAGVIAEYFGDNSFLIRAIPQSIALSGSRNFIEDLLFQLEDMKSGIPNYSLLATIACHASIRAGQRLPMQEMESLVRELANTTSPHTCPHGRPTVLELTNYFLDRSFGRAK